MTTAQTTPTRTSTTTSAPPAQADGPPTGPEKARQALTSRIAGSLIEGTNLSYADAEDAAEAVLGTLREDYQRGKLPGFQRLFDEGAEGAFRDVFGEDPFKDEHLFDELMDEASENGSPEWELDGDDFGGDPAVDDVFALDEDPTEEPSEDAAAEEPPRFFEEPSEEEEEFLEDCDRALEAV